jgi:hypothetical protein
VEDWTIRSNRTTAPGIPSGLVAEVTYRRVNL